MKKIITISFFLLQISLQAQTDFRFADSTARWNVWQHNWAISVVFPRSVYGDTVFAGKNYQVISGGWLRRDSSNKIYRWIGHDTLLYDFGAQVGDTIHTLAPGYQDYLYPALYIVDAIDTVVMGKPRLRMFLHGTQNTTWIDGIGDLKADPLTGTYVYNGLGVSHQNVLCEVSCFFENGQLLFGNPSLGNCITGINDLIEPEIQVYPLPATNQLTLEWSNSDLQSYSIYNAEGKLLSTSAIIQTANKTVIDCAAWPAGIYIVQLQTKWETYYRKVIVEH